MKTAILSLLVICMSCSSSKNTVTAEEVNNFKEIITTKNIEATFDWANPIGLNANSRGIESLLPIGSNSNNINLIGNPNFFRIKNDSIYLDLPYYGARQLGGGYATESGIQYKGLATKAKKEFNTKKGAYILMYSLKSKEENYDVTLTLYANHKSDLNVNSSHRTNINFNGNWNVFKTITE